MKTAVLFLAAAMATCADAMAQSAEKYVITGEMTRDSLRFTPQPIKKLYLQTNIDGAFVTIDSATVKDRKFRFEGRLKHPGVMANITGFDNGEVNVFLEPGEIVVKPFDAHYPVSAHIGGTPNNNILESYRNLVAKNARESDKRIQRLKDSLPDSIKNDMNKFFPYQNSNFHTNTVFYKVDVLRWLREHLDSEIALYVIRYDLFHTFTPKVVERQFLRAIPARLHSHPLYAEIENQIRAATLKEGASAPVFAGQTPDGKKLSLSDLKGKYVLVDVWASWCGPCRREFPFIKEALKASEANDKFVVLSYSIDSKMKDWISAIDNNSLKHKNWIHISTLKGWSSDVVSLYNITGVPYTVLLNPEGKVISFNLRGEAMVNKVKNIIDGTETYE